jgi:hypothetical protein
MVLSWVADGGAGLQIRKVAAEILNNQLRTAEKGWYSSWGLGERLTNPRRKKKSLLRNVVQGLILRRIFGKYGGKV